MRLSIPIDEHTVYQRIIGHKFTENARLIAFLWVFIKFYQLIMGQLRASFYMIHSDKIVSNFIEIDTHTHFHQINHLANKHRTG